MAKNIQQKQSLIDSYKNILTNGQGILLFGGNLNAKRQLELNSILKTGARLSLLKNTLFNISAKELGIDININDYNNAIFIEDNLIDNAAAVSKFIFDNELEARRVIVNKSIYEGSKLKQIANLGSNTKVYTKLVSVMVAPMTTLVRDLQNPVQKLALVLSQIKK